MLNNLSIGNIFKDCCRKAWLCGQFFSASKTKAWTESWIPTAPAENIILHFVFIFLVLFLLKIFNFFGIVTQSNVNYDRIEFFSSATIVKQLEFTISLNIFLWFPLKYLMILTFMPHFCLFVSSLPPFRQKAFFISHSCWNRLYEPMYKPHFGS